MDKTYKQTHHRNQLNLIKNYDNKNPQSKNDDVKTIGQYRPGSSFVFGILPNWKVIKGGVAAGWEVTSNNDVARPFKKLSTRVSFSKISVRFIGPGLSIVIQYGAMCGVIAFEFSF